MTRIGLHVFQDHRGVVGTAGPVADRQQSLAELLDREVLPCLERPGRLLGPFDLPSATVTGKTKMALVWPSIAEGAHAPAALRPLFVDLPNPRSFSLSLGSVPSPNLRAALRERGLPAFGRPDWVPLTEVDLWIVWLAYPLQLTGLLSVLDATGLEFRAATRQGGPRIVIAGPAVERVHGLARVYGDAVWVGRSTLDEAAWEALGKAAGASDDWVEPLRGLGEVLGPLDAGPPHHQEDLGAEGHATPERRDVSMRPDLGVQPEFLKRSPWREAGRADAFTDHLVIGAGSEELRRRTGLPETAALIRVIADSFRSETASLTLHFVLGLPGETEADRLAIAEFLNFVVAAAPRGARQVSVRLHELAVAPQDPVQLEALNTERAGRVGRILDRISARRLRIEVPSPGLSVIESVLAAGPQSARPLELVWSAGGRVAESEATTSHELWRRSVAGPDGAIDDGTEGPSVGPAPTGLPKHLRVEAPASVSPTATRKRLHRSRRPRPDRWTRWQALVPQRFAYRIEYGKQGRLRFLGPTELSDLLLGACERAGVPVCTSGVVQPRPRVGFGPTLSAGIAGDREYIDFSLETKVGDLEARLRNELPEEIRLHAVEFMPRCSPSLQLSRIALAEYEAALDAGTHRLPADREKDHARVRQWNRRIEEGLPPDGDAPDDPITQLRCIHWIPVSEDEVRLEFTLDMRTDGVRCKPRDVVSRALTGLFVDPRLVPLRRRKLLVLDESSGRARLRTPLEQARLVRYRQRALERMWAE